MFQVRLILLSELVFLMFLLKFRYGVLWNGVGEMQFVLLQLEFGEQLELKLQKLFRLLLVWKQCLFMVVVRVLGMRLQDSLLNIVLFLFVCICLVSYSVFGQLGIESELVRLLILQCCLMLCIDFFQNRLVISCRWFFFGDVRCSLWLFMVQWFLLMMYCEGLVGMLVLLQMYVLQLVSVLYQNEQLLQLLCFFWLCLRCVQVQVRLKLLILFCIVIVVCYQWLVVCLGQKWVIDRLLMVGLLVMLLLVMVFWFMKVLLIDQLLLRLIFNVVCVLLMLLLLQFFFVVCVYISRLFGVYEGVLLMVLFQVGQVCVFGMLLMQLVLCLCQFIRWIVVVLDSGMLIMFLIMCLILLLVMELMLVLQLVVKLFGLGLLVMMCMVLVCVLVLQSEFCGLVSILMWVMLYMWMLSGLVMVVIGCLFRYMFMLGCELEWLLLLLLVMLCMQILEKFGFRFWYDMLGRYFMQLLKLVICSCLIFFVFSIWMLIGIFCRFFVCFCVVMVMVLSLVIFWFFGGVVDDGVLVFWVNVGVVMVRQMVVVSGMWDRCFCVVLWMMVLLW